MKRRMLIPSIITQVGCLTLFMLLVVSSAFAEGGYPKGYAEDRAQIEDLLARYMFAMDFNDAEGFAALFAEKCTFIPKQGKDPFLSPAAIAADMKKRAKRYHPKPDASEKDKTWLPAHRHILSGLVLRVEGDRAYGSAYYTHIGNRNENRKGTVDGYGYYTDEYVKVNGRWYISSRKWSNETRENTYTKDIFTNPAPPPY